MDFVDRSGTLKIQATFRGQPVTVYTDSAYATIVLVTSHREFISGWRLNVDQSRNLRLRKSL